MASENAFKYLAFISYSRKDSAFAEELHRYLNHYKLPHKLCKQFPNLPTNLRPIFRDKTGLAIDELVTALQEALQASKFLIVICSENSARPNDKGKNWVDKEVEDFVAANPGVNNRRIIPVIYRKEGGARATACLPRSISSRGLLAADIMDKGRDRTFSDVVAKVLGLNPDALWDDYEREQAAKRRNRRIAAGVIATLAAAGGYAAWDYYTPHTYCYADYAECGNIPVGIGRLTGEQVAARHSHYRFTEHKRRIVRVSHCNSAGSPVRYLYAWETERPVTMTLEYNSAGNVAKRTHEDEHGVPKMVWRFHESGNIVNFETLEGKGLASASSFVSTGNIFDRQKSKKCEVVRFDLERDARGHVVRELYINPYTEPAEDENGVWGRAYERNEWGQVVRVRYLGREGAPMCTSRGISGYRLEYGAGGEVSKMTYTGEDGLCPATNDQKWAAMELTRDTATGNVTASDYFGTDGTPCLTSSGYAKVTYKYDPCGNWTEGAYFGTDGTPCLHKAGFYKWVAQYDSRGNLAEESYFGTDGKPCPSHSGAAKTAWRRDARGNKTEEAYFDTNGKPCLCKDGCAKVTWRYDTRGNLAEEAYFGTDGTPCRKKNGVAKLAFRYDARGNETEQAFFGTDGKPCLHQNGYAKLTWRYDARGNATEQAYFDTDGKPCLCKDGCAKVAWRYDTHGNMTEQAYFDTNGTPCLCQNGFAKVAWRYDDRGNMTEQAYFGTDGTPCLCKDGFAKVARRYNANGNLTEQAYFGTDGTPCLCKDGFAKVTMQYNANGSLAEQAFFGTDGTPCLCKDGFAKVRFIYNEHGVRTKIIIYNQQDRVLKELRLSE